MRPFFAVSIALFATSCVTASPPTGGGEQPADPGPPAIDTQAPDAAEADERQVAILAINDVYRIEGLLPSERGGLARFRTLRTQLEQTYPELLVLHAGDVLFPSLISREFNGEQMIDVMNQLDGTDPGFDDRLYVVFGNHEFDEDGAEDSALLGDRVHESDFTWLASNITFVETERRKVEGNNVKTTAVLNLGGVRVGLYGLTLGKDDVAYAQFASSNDELSRLSQAFVGELDPETDLVIALTHLPINTDRMLARLDVGPDLIVGGHEHGRIDETVNGRRILKADADLISANLILVTIRSDGSKDVRVRPQQLTTAPAKDAVVDQRIGWWMTRHSRRHCRKIGLPDDCLDDELATTTTPLAGEEITIRIRETALGSWLTDLILAAARDGMPAEQRPTIAFLNSGSLRLNQNLAGGDAVTRRHVEELVQYDDPLLVTRLSGDELQEALNWSASCRNEGPFLQVSGVTFTIDTVTGLAEDVRVDGTPVAQVSSVLAVTSRFLADPDAPGDQDGYGFSQSNIIGTVPNVSIKSTLLEALEDAPTVGGVRTISPTLPGRITLGASQAGPAKVCPK